MTAARRFRALRLLALLAILLVAPARAAMVGYATNEDGIHRIDTQTGAATLVYSGAPFSGSTTAAGAALRPSDGMLFFSFTNGNNQPVYRWNPLTPAVAPVQIGSTGVSVPYIHRLAFHPTNGNLYGIATNGSSLWVLNQTSGAASSVASLSGLPTGTSGDMAFSPIDGQLYAPIQQNNSSTATIYRVPLAGGAVVNVGTITGLSSADELNSAMFGPTGTLYIGGDSTSLKSVPITGGAATTIGNMGFRPQDFASVPAPDPTVAKSFSPTTVAANSNSTLTLTLTNSYAQPLRGAALTDTYPTGLVNAPTPGASTTCGGTVTATAGGNSVNLSGGTIPASGSCTITVSVRAASNGSYANTVPAGALTTLFASNSNTASATLTVGPVAMLTHVKSMQVTSDPYNGGVNPKAIPGADVLYTLTIANTGGGTVDNNGIAVVDPVPANTRLYLGDLGGAGSGPVAFANGSPASGLTWTYTSLASGTDDLEFSNNGGSTWTHVPTADPGGYDTSGTTHIRMRPKGNMAGASGGGNPSFQLRFRVRIN